MAPPAKSPAWLRLASGGLRLRERAGDGKCGLARHPFPIHGLAHLCRGRGNNVGPSGLRRCLDPPFRDTPEIWPGALGIEDASGPFSTRPSRLLMSSLPSRRAC